MKRRKFLGLFGLGGASLLAVPGFGFLYNSYKEAAVGLIMENLAYLSINKSDVEKFVEDYYKSYGKSLYAQSKVKLYYLFHLDSQQSWLVGDLTSRFLLSTDFFRNKMDESKPIKYIAFYDPYLAPCGNPFSAAFYPAEVS